MAIAKEANLTFLHHPLVPAHPEAYLLDRFFGFSGAGDPQYREVCLAGFNGRPCRAFLPCLDVQLVRAEAYLSSDALAAFVGGRPDACNTVFHMSARPVAVDTSATWDALRPAFFASRKLVFVVGIFGLFFICFVTSTPASRCSPRATPSAWPSTRRCSAGAAGSRRRSGR